LREAHENHEAYLLIYVWESDAKWRMMDHSTLPADGGVAQVVGIPAADGDRVDQGRFNLTA
jgi:hypothetical protein